MPIQLCWHRSPDEGDGGYKTRQIRNEQSTPIAALNTVTLLNSVDQRNPGHPDYFGLCVAVHRIASDVPAAGWTRMLNNLRIPYLAFVVCSIHILNRAGVGASVPYDRCHNDLVIESAWLDSNAQRTSEIYKRRKSPRARFVRPGDKLRPLERK